MLIELRAIDKDRQDAANTAAQVHVDEDVRFAGVLAQNQQEFTATMKRMEALEVSSQARTSTPSPEGIALATCIASRLKGRDTFQW